MIDHLLRLPYITYWLPVAVAVAATAPLLWFLRPRQVAAARPERTPPPDPEITGPSSEQRRSFRRGGNTIGIHYARPGQLDNPLHARLIDRSLGGLCLETFEAVTVGTILSVRPDTAEPIVPWVEIEVCVCRPNQEGFEVGCRFVKTPPYSILLLFG